jgi:hypothetical protein
LGAEEDLVAEAEWTILVFLNAKNNLEEFAFPNFEQMASVGSTPEVNILVEMGRPKRHFVTTHGAWSKTLRFKIGTNTKPIESNAIEDLGDTDMGDAATLARFVAWGQKNYPAKRTMLVIWNHGQGFRAPVDASGAETGPKVEVRPVGGHRSVSNDDDTGNQLYNRAIQDALTELLDGKRLDVIAFDACLMAMAETAYALRGVAKVMVGSEELEPGNGWNYETWLRPLVEARGVVDAVGVARLLVEGMRAEYGDTDDTTLSATDLDGVADLGRELTAFADAALPVIEANLPAFKAARAACKNYAPGRGVYSIDLGRYMEQIAEAPLPDEVREHAKAVRQCIGSLMIDNYASSRRQGGWGSNGLGIYYPATRAEYTRDHDGDGYKLDNKKFPLEFVQKERWAQFLHRYWALVP